MEITDLLKKSHDAEPFTHREIVHMLSYPPASKESYALMAEARRISELVTDGKAEVHGQFALDLAPCSCNCLWCSFAKKNGVFSDQYQLSAEEAVDLALNYEGQGVNAILTMTTASYPFSKLLEMAQEIRRALRPDTLLIANTSDKTLPQAEKMKAAGFDGVYHARRFREGIDSQLDPARRLETIHNFQTAGLILGTCVEPIGAEHSNDEIAELILFTASLRPAFGGAARRISLAGTDFAERGMISELRMAQCVAVTRIAMPRETRGNCTHEPCTLGAMAGATLFWAEIGANPRDIQEHTEDSRGKDLTVCRDIYAEAGWRVLEGVSQHFRLAPSPVLQDLPAQALA